MSVQSLTAVLDQSVSLQCTWVMLHFLWQGVAIAGLVFVLNLFASRLSSAFRYWVAVAGLFGMLASVIATGILLWPAPRVLPDINAASADYAVNSDAAIDAIPLFSAADVSSPPESLDLASAPASAVEYWSPIALAAYVIGVGLMLLRIVFSAIGLGRLRIASQAAGSVLTDRVESLTKQVGLSVQPALRTCERVVVPFVTGVIKPTILLPVSIASGMTRAELDAVLLHELAHIRRGDLVINFLQRIVESLLFFHPAVWYVSQVITVERENCCDDIVLGKCSQKLYASALVRLAESCAGNPKDVLPIAALAATGASPSQLKRRVMRILDIKSARRFSKSSLLTLLVFAVAIAATAVHLQAQTSDAREQLKNVSSTDHPLSVKLNQTGTVAVFTVMGDQPIAFSEMTMVVEQPDSDGSVERFVLNQNEGAAKQSNVTDIDSRDAELAIKVKEQEYIAAKKQAESTISIEAAVLAYEMAKADYESSLEANKKTPGADFEVVLRAQKLAAERAKLQSKLTVEEQRIAKQAAMAKHAELLRAMLLVDSRKGLAKEAAANTSQPAKLDAMSRLTLILQHLSANKRVSVRATNIKGKGDRLTMTIKGANLDFEAIMSFLKSIAGKPSSEPKVVWDRGDTSSNQERGARRGAKQTSKLSSIAKDNTNVHQSRQAALGKLRFEEQLKLNDIEIQLAVIDDALKKGADPQAILSMAEASFDDVMTRGVEQEKIPFEIQQELNSERAVPLRMKILDLEDDAATRPELKQLGLAERRHQEEAIKTGDPMVANDTRERAAERLNLYIQSLKEQYATSQRKISSLGEEFVKERMLAEAFATVDDTNHRSKQAKQLKTNSEQSNATNVTRQHISQKLAETESEIAGLELQTDGSGEVVAGLNAPSVGETDDQPGLNRNADVASEERNRMQEALAGLKEHEAELAEVYLPGHPERKRIRTQIQSIERKFAVSGPVRFEIFAEEAYLIRGKKEDVERVVSAVEKTRDADQPSPAEAAARMSDYRKPYLTGPVRIEFIEGTGIYVVRGKKEDVERVKATLGNLETSEAASSENKKTSRVPVLRDSSGRLVTDDRPDPVDELTLVSYRLTHATAEACAKTLTVIYTDDARLRVLVDAKNNRVIVRATQKMHNRIARIVKSIDQPQKKTVAPQENGDRQVDPKSIAPAEPKAKEAASNVRSKRLQSPQDAKGKLANKRVILLKHTQSKLLGQALTSMFGSHRLKAEGIEIAVDERTNSIIVHAPRGPMKRIQELVKQIDHRENYLFGDPSDGMSDVRRRLQPNLVTRYGYEDLAFIRQVPKKERKATNSPLRFPVEVEEAMMLETLDSLPPIRVR